MTAKEVQDHSCATGLENIQLRLKQEDVGKRNYLKSMHQEIAMYMHKKFRNMKVIKEETFTNK